MTLTVRLKRAVATQKFDQQGEVIRVFELTFEGEIPNDEDVAALFACQQTPAVQLSLPSPIRPRREHA